MFPFLLRFALSAVAFGLSLASPVDAAPSSTDVPSALPFGDAQAAGFDPFRLTRLPVLLAGEIASHHYAGAVWLVARDGTVVSHGAVGWRDALARIAMTEDSQFKLYSMSKIITTVTALTLLEEGKINLDDPVARYLPAFSHPTVLIGGTALEPELKPALMPITIRHLLTQTSGLTYDVFAKGVLREIWLKPELWKSRSLAEFVSKVAALPLAEQPGTRWTYGVNTDILGAVIEAVTGQDLETAMRARVFAPLGMQETSFRPSAEVLHRLALVHHRTADGGLEKDSASQQGVTIAFPSGGGGLFSTARDYSLFAQMLLNKGTLRGHRILGRKTVEMMTTNQIAGLIPPVNYTAPAGFGFGVRVRLETETRARSLGSAGTFGWEGLASTYVSMDPKEHLLLILLVQHSPQNEDGIFERFADTAYQALN